MSNIQPSGFSGDSGGADPGLTRALADLDGAGVYPVLAALMRARIFVPIVAELGEAETGTDGLVRDKSADVAAVLFQRPDGRRALIAFTGVDLLTQWNPAARPRPLSATDAARAAIEQGADALLLDLEGPVRFAVERADLEHIVAGHQIVATPAGYAWFALP